MEREAKKSHGHDHPIPIYPEKFKNIAGVEVPKGGSSCSSCEYLKDAEKRICGEPNFIKWNFGSDVIPGEIDSYCSIWWEEKK